MLFVYNTLTKSQIFPDVKLFPDVSGRSDPESCTVEMQRLTKTDAIFSAVRVVALLQHRRSTWKLRVNLIEGIDRRESVCLSKMLFVMRSQGRILPV